MLVKVFVNVFLAKASYTITAKCVVYKYILVLADMEVKRIKCSFVLVDFLIESKYGRLKNTMFYSPIWLAVFLMVR